MSKMKSGGSKKIGRNKVKCQAYKNAGTREINKAKKLAKMEKKVAKRKEKLSKITKGIE